MMKRLFLSLAVAAATVSTAYASPISGGFSLVSFSGSYVGGTAQTATGLDFGAAGGGTGNGYGVNGTAFVGNGSGSFAGLNGGMANITDISLGSVANPYTVGPFISFTGSPLSFDFSDATITRSSTGTSVTIAGMGTLSDGIAADTTNGMFALAASSQNGMPSDVNFTFTSNVSAAVTPEPSSIALLGTGLLGFAGVVRRRLA